MPLRIPSWLGLLLIVGYLVDPGASDDDDYLTGDDYDLTGDDDEVNGDSEGDGLSDSVEVEIGTDPYEVDSDGDSYSDDVEHLSDFFPDDSSDWPLP